MAPPETCGRARLNSSSFSGQGKIAHPTYYSKSQEKNEITNNDGLQLHKLERPDCEGQQEERGHGTGSRTYLRTGRPGAAVEDLRVQALA